MGQQASKFSRVAQRVATRSGAVVEHQTPASLNRPTPQHHLPTQPPPPPAATAPAAPASEYPEMSPEMVKFLCDIGPLKESTTDTTKSQPQSNRSSSKTKPPPRQNATSRFGSDPHRRVESMRLAENIQGFETNRTTNFSYKKDEVSTDGIELEDFYHLLNQPEFGNNKEEMVEKFCADRSLVVNAAQKELLRQSLQVLRLPVILRDSDNTYVGVFAERVEDLVRQKLVPVQPSQIKLVLQDLAEAKN